MASRNADFRTVFTRLNARTSCCYGISVLLPDSSGSLTCGQSHTKHCVPRDHCACAQCAFTFLHLINSHSCYIVANNHLLLAVQKIKFSAPRVGKLRTENVCSKAFLLHNCSSAYYSIYHSLRVQTGSYFVNLWTWDLNAMMPADHHPAQSNTGRGI